MGPVEKYLLDKVAQLGCIHLSLIDPEEIAPTKVANLSKSIEKAGTTAIMVGGSTVVSISQLDDIVKTIKNNVNIPVILFPSNLTGVSKHADAMWFLSLLNSSNPYFISGIQALAAPMVKKIGIESIPLGYIIIGDGSTAAYIGQAHSIPYDKPEVATCFSLAAQYLGMHFVYLEAGSRSKQPVYPNMVSMVKKNLDIPLIVGGGIKTKSNVKTIVEAGADVIVTGTIIEEAPSANYLADMINCIESVAESR
ncbi:MAG: geranylgeranylglyceryl/heptaprenylglyceryl phosphate synthase [Candidatus Bathyarchaeota archaeon]|nr:MAG: geranylgeranylglyceryl/heptaprenylglyceryl phosphate synthase [Candidatus Bathyarchaeota archaeon]